MKYLTLILLLILTLKIPFAQSGVITQAEIDVCEKYSKLELAHATKALGINTGAFLDPASRTVNPYTFDSYGNITHTFSGKLRTENGLLKDTYTSIEMLKTKPYIVLDNCDLASIKISMGKSQIVEPSSALIDDNICIKNVTDKISLMLKTLTYFKFSNTTFSHHISDIYKRTITKTVDDQGRRLITLKDYLFHDYYSLDGEFSVTFIPTSNSCEIKEFQISTEVGAMVSGPGDDPLGIY